MEYVSKIKKKFLELFNKEPVLFLSPGRVNLIGEHTDYNMGFVLPAAIDKAIYFAIAPNGNNECTLHSVDMNDEYKFSTNDLQPSSKHWANYLVGVVDQLQKMGHDINGFDCVFGGDIPIGAGLSSSAAIEAGLAFALNHIFEFGIEKIDLVKLAQKAENEFVGVQCGIMDQYINIFGKAGNVLRIDCRSLDYDYFPFHFDKISIVLFNTMVSHSLASSEYNNRRKECTSGVEIIQKKYPQVKSLRDVSVNMIKVFENVLNPVTYKRCKYVVEEIDRLIRACDSLTAGDLKSFGKLMYETHEGLSKDYQVSCEELDYLVELTKDIPEIYGSRMMGGGFGGCTINLIENNAVENISKEIAGKYRERFDKDPKIYIMKISNGTQIIRDVN